MASTFRLLRNFLRRDSAERLQAMREDAAADPEGVACWMASVALWEEGQIAEAHRMAESLLRSEPADFRMLVICLDWSIRCRDPDRILAFAKLSSQVATSCVCCRVDRPLALVAARLRSRAATRGGRAGDVGRVGAGLRERPCTRSVWVQHLAGEDA